MPTVEALFQKTTESTDTLLFVLHVCKGQERIYHNDMKGDGRIRGGGRKGAKEFYDTLTQDLPFFLCKDTPVTEWKACGKR